MIATTLTMTTLRRWLLAACAALGLAASAHAGIFDDDEARKAILDLRQRMEALKQDNLKRDADARKAQDDIEQLRRSMLDLQNQLDAAKADVARLRGQNEQLARDVADMQRRQKDLAQGVDERLRK